MALTYVTEATGFDVIISQDIFESLMLNIVSIENNSYNWKHNLNPMLNISLKFA